MTIHFTKRFLMMAGVAVAFTLSAAVQAEEAGKPAKTHVSKGKMAAAKKTEATVSGKPGCEAGGKKWRDGEHCMTTCNDKATSCDMQICKEGEWKPYSSCFGKGAVSPNCPPSCS